MPTHLAPGVRVDEVVAGPSLRALPFGAAVGVDRNVPIPLATVGQPAAEPIHVIHLSFEGPDPYSCAGGLAARVTSLDETLAAFGHRVDLYFVGDPRRAPTERRNGVALHRWCQAISSESPDGSVYDDEERKIADLCVSMPEHLMRVIVHDLRRGIRPVVLAEDWHMAWPLICLHDKLTTRGLRDRVSLAWTANNRSGFDRIDFARLSSAATILTISKAMKALMQQFGVNPRVVPNGLGEAWMTPDASDLGTGQPGPAPGRLTEMLAGRLLVAKVGRWDPDKRWAMAIEAIAALADQARPAVLLARGWNGSAADTAHAAELRKRAAELRLAWVTIDDGPLDDAGEIDLAGALAAHPLPHSAVVEIAFPVRGAQLRGLYREADVVLANSGFEPFGLVGLEAMSAGAVVIAGSTGEDYIRPFRNGFALDTDDAAEIVDFLDWLNTDPRRRGAMRQAALATSREYRWVDIAERLMFALGLPTEGWHEPIGAASALRDPPSDFFG